MARICKCAILTVSVEGKAKEFPVISAGTASASAASTSLAPTMKYRGFRKCSAAILLGSRVNVAEKSSF
jgi:hypothetical protein